MPPRDAETERRGVGRRIMTLKTNAQAALDNNQQQQQPRHPINGHAATNGNGSHSTVQYNDDENEQQEESEPCCYFFLTKQAAQELPRYQYHGEDLSLLYKYVLSPLASFCVEHLTPIWLAPNSITLIGLLFMVAAYLAMWYYAPALQLNDDDEEETPRWIFLLNGIAILVYQTLDNMDGKQARRTGNGSPLGLLFDHGCDAVNNVFGSANWMISMALHPVRDVYLCASMLFGPYALFFFGTWEEYYTGKLIMPIINGPNEGLMGGAIMSFLSFWFGPKLWHQTHAWDLVVYPLVSAVVPLEWLPATGLRNADCLVLFSTYNFFAEPLDKAINVVRHYGGVKTLINLVPFFTLLGCALIVGATDLNVWLDMPRTSLHLCAALFVEMTVELMMCHMTKQRYTYLRWPLLPLVLLSILVGTGTWSAGRQTADFLLIYTSGITTYLVFKTVVTIHEICSILNIWCFDITTKRPARKTKQA